MKLGITLYKKCILNDKYKNVISTEKLTGHNISILEEYLNTLSNYTIEVQNIYYENDGELVFDYDWFVENTNYNIYEFNYMKVILYDDENNIKLLRYCFINDIQVKNNCVYLDYKEDIWSSYFNSIEETQDCNIVNSRLCHYKNLNLSYKKLLEKYDGNNILDIHGENSSNCHIILELQAYNLISGSPATTDNRETRMVVLNKLTSQIVEGVTTYSAQHLFSKTEAFGQIEQLLKYMSSQNPHLGIINGQSNPFMYYEIGNIYFIPEIFNISNLFYVPNSSLSNCDYFLFYYSSVSLPSFAFQPLRDDLSNTRRILKSGSIQNNYKNKSFGTFNTQVDLENNGTDIEYNVAISYDRGNLGIALSIQNSIIDITKDFNFIPNYDVISSQENSQRRLSLQLKYNEYETGYLVSSTKMYIDAIKYGVGLFGGMAGGYSDVDPIKSGRDILENRIKSLQYEERMNLIYQPVYSNSKMITTNNLNHLNYIVGLYRMEIDPDNSSFVKKTTDNLGYKTFEFIGKTNTIKFKDIFDVQNAEGLNANYDVIKLLNPSVYGNFTNVIANQINDILENGVKIWYNKDFTLDTITNNLL